MDSSESLPLHGSGSARWVESSESDGYYSSIEDYNDSDEDDAVYLSEQAINSFLYAPSTPSSGPDYQSSVDSARVENGIEEVEDDDTASDGTGTNLADGEDDDTASDGTETNLADDEGNALDSDGETLDEYHWRNECRHDHDCGCVVLEGGHIGPDEPPLPSSDDEESDPDEESDSDDYSESDSDDDEDSDEVAVGYIIPGISYADLIPFEPIPDDVQWLSDDQTQIFDPATETFIPIPDRIQDIKDAFAKAFWHFTKILILTENHINMEHIYSRWVPEELWTLIFSDAETIVMVWAQERSVYAAMEKAYDEILSNWLELDVFPDIPYTTELLTLARTEEERIKRIEEFYTLLDPINDEVDGWLLDFFEPFEAVIDLDLIRSGTLSRQERTSMINIMVSYADAQFVLCVLHHAELHIAFRDAVITMRGLENDLARVRFVIPEEGWD